MLNVVDKDVTIGKVVAELPQAAEIFGSYGIDYCCGGNRKLNDVIIELGINEDEVFNKLQAAYDSRHNRYEGDTDFVSMEPVVLADYIEDTHHGYLRQALPQIAELLNTVLRVHGKNHTELFTVYRLFGTLKSDLEQHLLKEETMLFPAFTEAGSKDEILRLTDDIIKEHEAAGRILGELREVTDNYAVPSDACGSFNKVYRMLEELEQDLHQHIHLENNILLKDYDRR